MSAGTVIQRSLVVAAQCIFLISIAVGSVSAQKTDCPPGGGPGQWSVSATDLSASSDWRCADENSRDLRISSPDHRSSVLVKADRWWIEVDGKRVPSAGKDSNVGYPAELAWSPDSKSLYITQSDGSIAGFHTNVYTFEDGLVKEVLPKINELVEHEFNQHHACRYVRNGKRYMDSPNVAGLAWSDDSTSLLVVAEVRPDSDCDREYFGGYLVSIATSEIKKTYSPQELKDELAKTIGSRLQGDFKDLSKRQRDAKP